MGPGGDDTVDSNDPVATAAVHAIRTGDTTSLASLLSQHPGLASEQIHETRTPLHVVTDWPGYFPAALGSQQRRRRRRRCADQRRRRP
jgi:hypothetical protein